MTANKIFAAIKLIFSILLFSIQTVWAQADQEFASYSTKYPGYPFIITKDVSEVEISIKKSKLRYTFQEYRESIVLGNNATDYADSKSYFNNFAVIKKMEAYSLVPNQGSYKKIQVKEFTKSTEDDNQLYVDDSYYFGFVYPSVTKGTKMALDENYYIDEPFIPLKFYFGNRIPIDEFRVKISFPDEVKLKYTLFNCNSTEIKMSSTHKGGVTTYMWEGSQPKTFDKDFMAPSLDYFRPHIILQVEEYDNGKSKQNVLGSLPNLYRWKKEQLNKVKNEITPEIKALADSITTGYSTPKEKVSAIYRWVQNNIKYIAIEDGENGYVPRNASLVLQRRYGDCKDKSSVLKVLISAIGEKASFMTVGTRDIPYKFTEVPSTLTSNHMVAAWWQNDSTPTILDGTTMHYKMEDVPAFIQGKECIIEKGDTGFVVYKIPIADADANLRVDSIFLSFANNRVEGKGKTTAFGETKAALMYALDDKMAEKLNSTWIDYLFLNTDKIELTSIKASDFANATQPFSVDYSFSLPNYTTFSSENMYLNMNLIQAFSKLDIKRDRTMPIESESTIHHRIVTVLQIPQGMKTGELPDNISFSHPKFSFTSKYQKSKEKIILSTDIYINSLLIENDEVSIFKQMIDKLKSNYRNTLLIEKSNS